MTKFLKFLILLDGSEFRLLTAQDSAAAKPLLLLQSKSHDSMDSIRNACSFPNLSAYKFKFFDSLEGCDTPFFEVIL